MVTDAQRRAIARYEASGKRPGKMISARMDKTLIDSIEQAKRPKESFGACMKRLIRRGLQMD